MKRVAVLLVCLSSIARAFAQESSTPPTHQQMQQAMDATMAAVVPYMSSLVEAMLQSQLRVMSKPESAAQMAQYVRNFYDALIKQGFTKEEALQIATSVAMPSVALPSK